MASPAEDNSLYAVLNVSKNATDEEIKRAYRRLAQVFHPDKHTSDHMRDKAQEAFARLQKAYEVLSDPEKREVYDIYGEEGLVAGLEVGPKLKSVDEMRKEWSEFKAQQERQRQEAMSNHRGYYLARIDATRQVAGDWSSLPVIRMMIIQNSLDLPFGEKDAAHVQAQVLNKGHAGAGALVAGYKRQIDSYNTLEGNVVLSARPVASATSSRRLGSYTTAGLTASYVKDQGLSLALTSGRQLGHGSSAMLSWTLGPSPLSALSLAWVRRGQRLTVTIKLDLGLVTALGCKLAFAVGEATSVRASGRLYLGGADAELGVSRRLSPITTAYVGTAVGPAGVQFKLRCNRGGQALEFPILLSGDYSDWRLVAASTVLPPLGGVLVMRFVVRPMRRWVARQRAAAAEEEHREALRAAAAKAAREAALLAPVAARKAAAEAAEDGLVVLLAVYGLMGEWRTAGGLAAAAAAPGSAAGASDAVAPSDQGSSATSSGEQQQPADGRASSHQAASSSGSDAPGAADAIAAGPPPPHWLDVTAALQYLVVGSKLELHAGIPKQGLMGFADVAVGCEEERRLYVVYSHKRQLLEKEVGELEGLRLPGAGQAVKDAQLAQQLGQQLAQLKQGSSSSSGGGTAGSRP